MIRVKSIAVILFTLSSLCYYSYDLYTELIFKGLIFEEDSRKRIQEISGIYHPVFKTTHRFYRSGTNRSISLEIAVDYWKLGDKYSAKLMFERALLELPKDLHVKLNFAHFLLSEKQELNFASFLLKEILSTQKNHHLSNLYLADIAIQKGDLDKAVSHLKCEYLDRRDPYFIALELELYQNGYLSSCCNIDQSQVDLPLQDLSDIKKELLDINLSKERKRAILITLKRSIRRFEVDLFQVIDDSKKEFYLSSTSSHTLGRHLWLLNYTTQINNSDKQKLIEIMNASFFKQRNCQLTSLINQGNYCTTDLISELKIDLKLIFSKSDYEKIVDYEKRVPWLLTNVY